MQRKAQVVVVLGTGGTIAGLAASPTEHLEYRSAQLGVADLVAASPNAARWLVETEQVAQIDSKDMSFAIWRTLACRIAHHAARPEVAGLVVTHGTDTLEETAYFLARVLPLRKPVVLTAAMRPASSLEADGPGNLADAIAIAARPEWPGVVVVLAGEVHAARDVRKVHPHRVDAFSSGEAGPVGQVTDDSVRALRSLPALPDALGIAALPEEPSAWPWVEIVASDAGANGRIVGLLAQAGVDGIVVAGTGNGTIHRRIALELAAASRAGISILRSSRCLEGAIVESEAGLYASAGELTPVKARVELIVRLLARRQGPNPAR
jgi:L-asparaginase